MKKAKRLLSLCLAIVMVMTGLVFSVGANAQTVPNGDGAITIEAPDAISRDATISTQITLRNTTAQAYDIQVTASGASSLSLVNVPSQLNAGASQSITVSGTRTAGSGGIAYTVRYRAVGSSDAFQLYTASAYSYYYEPTVLGYTFADMYRKGSNSGSYRGEARLYPVIPTQNDTLTSDRDKYWCEGTIYYDKDKYTGFGSGENQYPLQYLITKTAGAGSMTPYGDIWLRKIRIGITGAASGSDWEFMTSIYGVRESAKGGQKTYFGTIAALDTDDNTDRFGGTGTTSWTTSWGTRPVAPNGRTYKFDDTTSKPSNDKAGNLGRLDDVGDTLHFTFTGSTDKLPTGNSQLWFDTRSMAFYSGILSAAYIAHLVNYNFYVYDRGPLRTLYNSLKDTDPMDYYQGDTTWQTFVAALANAAYYLDTDKDDMTQADVTTAYQTLETAFNNLRRAARITVNHVIERAGTATQVTIPENYVGYAGQTYSISLLASAGENTYTNSTYPVSSAVTLAAGTNTSVTINYWTINTSALLALRDTSVTHATYGVTFAGVADILARYPLSSGAWTTESWNASGIEAAYAAVAGVIAAATVQTNAAYNTTRQADVDAAAQALQNAVNALVATDEAAPVITDADIADGMRFTNKYAPVTGVPGLENSTFPYYLYTSSQNPTITISAHDLPVLDPATGVTVVLKGTSFTGATDTTGVELRVDTVGGVATFTNVPLNVNATGLQFAVFEVVAIAKDPVQNRTQPIYIVVNYQHNTQAAPGDPDALSAYQLEETTGTTYQKRGIIARDIGDRTAYDMNDGSIEVNGVSYVWPKSCWNTLQFGVTLQNGDICEVTLTDRWGNVYTEEIIIAMVDNTAPTIMAVKGIVTVTEEKMIAQQRLTAYAYEAGPTMFFDVNRFVDLGAEFELAADPSGEGRLTYKYTGLQANQSYGFAVMDGAGLMASKTVMANENGDIYVVYATRQASASLTNTDGIEYLTANLAGRRGLPED